MVLNSDEEEAFASSSFDPCAYINGILSSPLPTTPSASTSTLPLQPHPLQSCLHSLSSSLLLLNEQLAKSLAETTTITFPRIGNEMQRIRGGGEGLEIERAALRSKQNAVERHRRDKIEEHARSLGADGADGADARASNQYNKVLDQIHQTSNLQRNLLETSLILDSLKVFQEVKEQMANCFLESDVANLVKLLGKLKDASKSELLDGMPGREERDSVINKMTTNLTTLLKPQLLHALKGSRLDTLQTTVSMYRQIDQMGLCRSEYVRNRVGGLHRKWFAFGGTSDFSDFLASFLKECSEFIREERTRIETVFCGGRADGSEEGAWVLLADIVCEVLEPTSNSFKSRLSSLPTSSSSGSSPSSPPEMYAKCFSLLLGFLLDLNEVLGEEVGAASMQKIYRISYAPFAQQPTSYIELEKEELTKASSKLHATLQQLSTSLIPTDDPMMFTVGCEEFGAVMSRVWAEGRKCLVRAEGVVGRRGDGGAAVLGVVGKIICNFLKEVHSCVAIMSHNSKHIHAVFQFDHLRCLFVLSAILRVQTEVANLDKLACELFDCDGRYNEEDNSGVRERIVASLTNGFAGTAAASQTPVPKLAISTNKISEKLIKATLSFFHDVATSTIYNFLSGMSSWGIWKGESVGDTDGSEYSILPQAYITGIGEHLLSLVQHLDSLLNDGGEGERLVMSSDAGVLRTLEGLGVKMWRDLFGVVGVVVSEEEVWEVMLGSSKVADSGGNANDGDNSYENDEVGDSPAAKFCNTVMTGIGCGLVATMLCNICKIVNLNDEGCEHLTVDLSYLGNVFNVLGLSKQVELLAHVADFLNNNKSREEMKEALRREHDNDDARGKLLIAVENTLVRMRTFDKK